MTYKHADMGVYKDREIYTDRWNKVKRGRFTLCKVHIAQGAHCARCTLRKVYLAYCAGRRHKDRLAGS